MKRYLTMLLFIIAYLVLLMPWEGRAACRNPNIVDRDSFDGEFSVVPARGLGFHRDQMVWSFFFPDHFQQRDKDHHGPLWGNGIPNA